MNYRIQGAAESHARVVAGPAAGSGWLRVGMGSGSSVVQQPKDQQADGPQNLADTQDIHHHLGATGPAGADGDASGCASAGDGAASH